MNIAQLRTFCIASECLSFTEASHRLFISQPAISRQVSALEKEIGIRLFERSNNSIRLTSAGHYLANQLIPVLNEFEQILEEAAKLAADLPGKLRVGLLSDQCIDEKIGTAVTKLMQANAKITIHRMSFLELNTSLATGEIDVAISIEQDKNAFSGYNRKLYAEESMLLAVNKEKVPVGYDKDKTDVSFQDLPVPVLVPRVESFRKDQEEALRSMTRPAYSNIVEYDFDSIATMVSAGLAATVVNESHILSTEKNILMLPMQRIPKIKKGLFWNPKNQNPLIEEMLSALAPE